MCDTDLTFLCFFFFHFQELLDTLQKDPDKVRNHLSESLRKLTVLKVNEKKLSLRYAALLEEVQFLQKENDRLKDESTQMEISVTKKVGELQRYKVRLQLNRSWLQQTANIKINKYINDLNMYSPQRLQML